MTRRFPTARPTTATRRERVKPKVKVHVPVDSGSTTHDGQRICTCGEVWDRPVHDLSAIPDTRELDARRIGEGVFE